jgi:phosphate transport system permease protein
MANRALGDPRVPGPQPTAKSEVVSISKARTAPLIKAGTSHVTDQIFYLAMLGCGLCVLGLVGLIVYELITKSSLSLHAFGWKFFFRSEWDPVNEQFGAWPFVYGTVVSSILALALAVTLAI